VRRLKKPAPLTLWPKNRHTASGGGLVVRRFTTNYRMVRGCLVTDYTTISLSRVATQEAQNRGGGLGWIVFLDEMRRF